MPKEVDEYIHRFVCAKSFISDLTSLYRIGRTGRVGNTGRATSFFDERENAALARPLVKVNDLSLLYSVVPLIPQLFTDSHFPGSH